jgi:hypothetical protein
LRPDTCLGLRYGWGTETGLQLSDSTHLRLARLGFLVKPCANANANANANAKEVRHACKTPIPRGRCWIVGLQGRTV